MIVKNESYIIRERLVNIIMINISDINTLTSIGTYYLIYSLI